jgi:hypothetical protein
VELPCREYKAIKTIVSLSDRENKGEGQVHLLKIHDVSLVFHHFGDQTLCSGEDERDSVC